MMMPYTAGGSRKRNVNWCSFSEISVRAKFRRMAGDHEFEGSLPLFSGNADITVPLDNVIGIQLCACRIHQNRRARLSAAIAWN